MKKHAWPFLCLALFLQGNIQAQFENLAPLEQERLSLLPTKTAQIDTLNEWAYQTTGAIASQYAAVALLLAQHCGYRQGASDAYVQLGSAAQDMVEFAKAIQYYKAALRERLIMKQFAGVASCYNRMAQVERLQGHYDASIRYCHQGIQVMKDQALHINTAYLYNTLGTAAKYAGFYETADSAFKAGIHIYWTLAAQTNKEDERRKYIAGLAVLRMNTGAFLQESRHRYLAAKDSLLKSLAVFQRLEKHENVGKCLLLLGNNAYYEQRYDSAVAYYQKGLDLREKITKTDYYILLRNRGRVQLDQGQFQPAYNDFRSSLNYFSSTVDTPNIATVLFEIGNWYYEQTELDSALVYYQQALVMNEQDNLLKGRILYFLSDALDFSGRREEAAVYTKAYVAVLDELRRDPTKGALGDLIRHQLDKNRLLKRLALQREKQAQYLTFTVVSLFSLLLFLAVLIIRVLQQKRRLAEAEIETAYQRETIALQKAEKAQKEEEIARQGEKIAYQNEQIAIQEKLEIIKNKEMETHYARLEAQDNLQKQISQELHDGVGTMLAAVKINLFPVDEVINRFSSEKHEQYSKANRLLDEACQELRRVSHELGSVILDQFGLKNQLEAFANILKNSGKYEVELDLHALDGRFDKKLEVNIYRIVQELVSNIIKHAQANRISISVSHLDNMINLIVEDDGIGFHEAKVQEKPGFGLISIKSRVHDLNGHMFIDTRKGRGTLISIDVPLFPQNN